MKKGPKIVEITGLRGLALAAFSIVCLAAGFVAFPGFLAKLAWNHFASMGYVPAINLFQGVLLWGIVVISCYITCTQKKKSFIEFKTASQLDDAEVREIMSMVKRQGKANCQPMIISAEDLEKFRQQQMIRPIDFQADIENKSVKEEKKEKEQV